MRNVVKEKDYSLRDHIIDVATVLFYEKGYKKTTYTDIAEQAKVSLGAITHYFPNKGDIAGAVYTKFSSKNLDQLRKRIVDTFGVFEYKYAYTMQYLLMNEIYSQDENARIFFSEFTMNSFYAFMDCTSISHISEFQKYYKIDIDENSDEAKLIEYAERGTLAIITCAYFDNKINCSMDKISAFVCTNGYSMMKFSKQESEELYNTAKNMFKELNISILPYFSFQ